MPIAITPGQAPVHQYFYQQQQPQLQQQQQQQSPPPLPSQQPMSPDNQATTQFDAVQSPADIPTTSTPIQESTPPPNVTASPIAPHAPVGESFDFTRHYGSSAIDDDDDEDDDQDQQRRQQQSHLDGFRNNVGRRDTWTRTMLPGRRSTSSSSIGSGIQGLRSFAMTQVNPDPSEPEPEITSGPSSPSISRHASISSSDQIAVTGPNVSLPSTDQGSVITMQPRPPTPPRRNSINTSSRSRPQSASASPVMTTTTRPVDAGDDRIRGINDTVSLLRRMLGVENNQDDAIASQALESMERWIQERLARPNVPVDVNAPISPVQDAPEQPVEADMMEGVIMGDPAMQGLDADGNPIESEAESEYVQVRSPDEAPTPTSPISPPTSINLPPRQEFSQFTLATPFSSVGALPPLTPQSEKPPTNEPTASASSSGASTPSAVTGTRMTLERGYYSRMERMERRHRRDDEGDCGGGGGGGGSCSGGFGAVVAGR